MRDTGRVLRSLRGAVVLLLVSGCGSVTAEISPDNLPPPASVTPAACKVVPSDAVAAALAMPTPAELPAGSATPAPQATAASLPVPPPTYTVKGVGAHSTVGQCTYQSPRGPALVVNVFPKTTLAGLADYTAGASQLGPAMLRVTDTAGLVTFQDGAAAVALALDVGGLTQDALTRRLAALASAVTGQSVPVPSQSAGSASTPSAAATPPPAGQTVTGVTAAQTVQETAALKFDPASVTVSAGQVVGWTNTGSIPHNVTFDADPELTSSTMNQGDKHMVKFLTPGQYQYHCTFHPGMDGTVTVS
jgi:plastocyanin